MSDPMPKSEKEWRERLDPDAYRVLREKGTEPPFTGEYWNVKDAGVYRCRGCGEPLFSSATKYESGSGWPSFTDPVENEAVRTERDTSHGMTRTEVLCAKCGGHLGHVFPDGPGPNGLRFCVNSCALELDREDETGDVDAP